MSREGMWEGGGQVTAEGGRGGSTIPAGPSGKVMDPEPLAETGGLGE